MSQNREQERYTTAGRRRRPRRYGQERCRAKYVGAWASRVEEGPATATAAVVRAVGAVIVNLELNRHNDFLDCRPLRFESPEESEKKGIELSTSCFSFFFSFSLS